MWTITSVLLCTCLVASEAPRADRRRLEAYNYQEVAKLTAADAATFERFGTSAAIDGDTVVIGASGAGTGGAVYVLRTSDGGATYVEMAKLTAADAAASDLFGGSVAIAGDTVVVGANGKDGSTGAAYVFHTTDGGTTYNQVAKLTAVHAADGDRFGRSVAIDGDTIVVGAPYDDTIGTFDTDSGAVYVFRTTNGGATYGLVTKLLASDAAEDDIFGISVAIDGDTIVVGASGANSDRGAVYVFRTNDGGATYGQVAKLTAADAAVNDGPFFLSVAINGDTIVIGAYAPTYYGGSGWGSAYVFHTTDGGASYDQVAKLTASDAAEDDYFGYSVAIDGSTIVVGATYTSTGGAAYVFSPPAPTSQPTVSPQPTTGQPTAEPTTAQPTAEPTSQPTTGQPTPQPTPEPTQQQQQQDLVATILICVAAAVVCACGSLAYARYVRSAKKESPSTTTADPTKLHEVHGRMVGWYEGQVALRQRWGPFPTRPELLEAWPGFIPVTNAFADAIDGPASTEVLPAEESAPEMLAENPPGEEEESWSARGLQRLASWRATPEEEV